MTKHRRTRRQALLICTAAALGLLVSAGLATAAMLVPAPPAVVPVVAIICVASPVFASWDLPGAIASLWTGPTARDERAVGKLRRRLERLPETQHPLGL